MTESVRILHNKFPALIRPIIGKLKSLYRFYSKKSEGKTFLCANRVRVLLSREKDRPPELFVEDVEGLT